jgi:2-polyprenyl-3-methyl-5-hydroxy-6-metoxy-1,4-benzoquinol methylase
VTAAERWADALGAWAIPAELLNAADDSPYGWPQSMWRRRTEMAREESVESVTTGIVRKLAGPGGAVLDVGAGRGRASLPLAVEGHPLTAVEPDAAMAAGLAEDAGEAGVGVRVVEGRWPDVASQAGLATVVMSANVVYDVADIAPFLRAMEAAASSGVVIELTATHPWSVLAPYYLALHGLERPAGPTVDDLVEVVSEVINVEPQLQRWSRAGQMWFADWNEITEYYGRRLVLPRERRPELRPMLEPDVVESDGHLFIGDGDRQLATIWWTSSS